MAMWKRSASATGRQLTLFELEVAGSSKKANIDRQTTQAEYESDETQAQVISAGIRDQSARGQSHQDSESETEIIGDQGRYTDYTELKYN